MLSSGLKQEEPQPNSSAIFRQLDVSRATGEQIRPHKKGRLYGTLGESITLLVGREEIPIVAHKSILCSASPFFEAACKQQWMQPGKRVIKLDEEPVVLRVIVYWMYYNQLCLPAEIIRRPTPIYANDLDNGPGLLVKIWMLGVKYQIPLLRNDIIDALLLWAEGGGQIPARVIQYAWDNTDEDDTSWALRHLLIRHVKLNYNYSEMGQLKEYLSHDFLLQTTESFIKDREMGTLIPDDEELNTNGYYCALWHTHGRESRHSCLETEKKDYVVFEDRRG